MKFVFALLFLILLGLSTFLSRPFYQKFLQKHMAEKIARNFADAEIDAGDVRFDHLHASLQKELSPRVRHTAVEQIDRVWGAYIEADPRGVGPITPLPSPRLFVHGQSDGALLLRGEIGSEDERGRLIKAAESIEGITSVKDELEIAKVAKASWLEGAVDFLPILVSQSSESELLLSEGGVRVAGLVEDQAIHDRLEGAAKALPNSSVSFEEALEVVAWQEPYWQITAGPASVVVEGLLPNGETQAALLETVRVCSKEVPVEDRTTVGERVYPVWWGPHSGQLIPELAEHSPTGYVARYERGSVSARALVGSEASQGELVASVEGGLPSGVTALPEISFTPAPPPPAPEPTKLADQLKLLPVYFGTDSADIPTEELAKIAKAAEVIKQVGGGASLTVGGYADLRGSADYNRALSLRRARAVRARLIGLGVAAVRLEVNHFGEDTSEMADEDLWKSRRVELSITAAN